MTLYLILDENIIVLSAKVQDVTGIMDNTCTQLLSDILKKHDVIRVNKELFAKYFQKLKSLESTIHSTAYTVKLLNLLRTSGLIHEWLGMVFQLNNENMIDPDDIYIVRLAAASKTNLVSVDIKLRQQLIDAEILKNHKFQFLEPTEVYS